MVKQGAKVFVSRLKMDKSSRGHYVTSKRQRCKGEQLLTVRYMWRSITGRNAVFAACVYDASVV